MVHVHMLDDHQQSIRSSSSSSSSSSSTANINTTTTGGGGSIISGIGTSSNSSPGSTIVKVVPAVVGGGGDVSKIDLIHGLHKPITPVGDKDTKNNNNTTTTTGGGGGSSGSTNGNSNSPSTRSWEYVVRSGVAGGVAGSCAKTLIAPLDRIKILFQTGNPHYLQFRGSMDGLCRAVRHIYSIDGVRGFYQGHSATLLRIFPYAAIKFITYEQFRNIIIPDHTYETHFRRLLSGACAGLCSVFFTYPLDLVRVRMAYVTHRKEAKLTSVIKDIYHNSHDVPHHHHHHVSTTGDIAKKSSSSSLKNFYRGFMPTMYGMVPYAGVAFFTHDLVHDIFKSKMLSSIATHSSSHTDDRRGSGGGSGSGRVMLKSWAELLSGGLAGMLSQTAAYPFEIIRRRLQVTKLSQLNTVSMARIIFKEKGWRGFYVGLSIGYIKVTPMVACSFYVYEHMKHYLNI